MVLGPTILVVDDELASRIALRRIFSRAGYRYVDASTGAEALERMSEHRCEIIVLDPVLADMDGFELIRVIRHRSAMPIIVLSTSDDERAKVLAFDLGVDDYVSQSTAIPIVSTFSQPAIDRSYLPCRHPPILWTLPTLSYRINRVLTA